MPLSLLAGLLMEQGKPDILVYQMPQALLLPWRVLRTERQIVLDCAVAIMAVDEVGSLRSRMSIILQLLSPGRLREKETLQIL